MAELNPPQFMQNRTDHTAQGDRLNLSGLFVRAGVRSETDLLVQQQAVADMSVRVGVGHGYIAGSQDAAQGYYHVYNDAFVTKTIGASSGTLSRIDLIVARVQDSFYTGATDAWDLFVVAGTPGSPGVRPSLPNNCIELAQVAIGISATSITTANITRTAVVMGLRGGVIPVASQTERDTIATFAGLTVFRNDTDRIEFYDGSAWRGGTIGPTIQAFTSSGTWTKPAGATRVRIRVMGGGGGGGGVSASAAGEAGQGGGGGGGGYAEKLVDASTLGATVSVTIGAGGSAGSTAGGTGGTGGTTSFGSTVVSASGGGGGVGSNPSNGHQICNGGSGGATFVGHDVGLGGSEGGFGLSRLGFTYSNNYGGAGAVLGSSQQGNTSNGAGTTGSRGSGGTGARSTGSAAAAAGGAGGVGYCTVETFYN